MQLKTQVAFDRLRPCLLLQNLYKAAVDCHRPGARTCIVDEVGVARVGGDERHELVFGQVELAQSEEGLACFRVVLPQEALDVLQAFCTRPDSETAISGMIQKSICMRRR